MSAKKKTKKTPYRRPATGPGSQGQQMSLSQVIAQGVTAWERDDFEEAYGHFHSVLDDHPNFADVHNKAGLCLAMMGDAERALERFDAALELNGNYAEAHLNRAIVLNDLGRFDEASEGFHRASDLDTRDSRAFPSDLGHRLAESHALTGDLYLGANRPEQAVKEYAAAVAIRPRFADLRFKLAESYMDLDRLDDAKDHLEAILEMNPHFHGARVRLGALLKRQGDTEGARHEWERCAEQAPNDERIRAYLASLGE